MNTTQKTIPNASVLFGRWGWKVTGCFGRCSKYCGRNPIHVPGCQHPDNRTETDEISNEIRDACRSPQKEIIENKAMGPEYCFSLVETLVDELRKRKANIAENRSDRYAIGCSLASELKERGRAFFHTVSSLSAKYDARECDRQYDRCLIHCDRYTLDTFFRYCKGAWLRW